MSPCQDLQVVATAVQKLPEDMLLKLFFFILLCCLYFMFFFQEPSPHGASKAPSGTGGSALNIDWFCFPDWCMLKLVLIVQGEPTAAPPAGQTPLEPTPSDVKSIIAQASRDRCLT